MTTGRLIGLIMVFTLVFTGMAFGRGIQVKDFFTCEAVIQREPQKITTSFNDDTEKVTVFMKLENIYESLEITWEWTHLSGQNRLSQTQIVSSPGEQGYDFWEEYKCWGILDLSQMSPDKKRGRWEIRATSNGELLGLTEFSLSRSSPSETVIEKISLPNEGSIENIVFNYPSDWYFYDGELDEGFCQVWLLDNEGSFISFSIYLTNQLLLEEPWLNENLIKREKTTLSGLSVDHAMANIYDETDSEWYKSSIYQISDYWSLSGKYIFLVSYAPVEKYDKYAGIFMQMFESVGIILF